MRKDSLIELIICILLGVLLFALAQRASASEIPTAPSFLRETTLTDTHRKSISFGFRGAHTTWKEIPVLKRHPKLKGVHKDLIKIMEVASKHVQLKVFEGCRSVKHQIKMYKEKKSTIGAHNIEFARHVKCAAIDVTFINVKGKIVWKREQAIATIKFLRGIGAALGIRCLRDGSSWDKDMDVSNNRFMDAFHLEIKRNCKG